MNALDQGSGCHDGTENTCDMGFPVMNRPHAVTQFLAKLPAELTEQCAPLAPSRARFARPDAP